MPLRDEELLAAIPMLWRYARAYPTLGVDPAELMQKTCTRAIANRTLCDGTNSEGWLVRTMQLVAMDEVAIRQRALARYEPLPDEETDHGAPKIMPESYAVPPPQEHAVLAIETMNAMSRLSPSDQRILMLAGYGYTDSESADIEGLASKETAKTRLRRARIKLIEALC